VALLDGWRVFQFYYSPLLLAYFIMMIAMMAQECYFFVSLRGWCTDNRTWLNTILPGFYHDIRLEGDPLTARYFIQIHRYKLYFACVCAACLAVTEPAMV
jgi:hypothetical protein